MVVINSMLDNASCSHDEGICWTTDDRSFSNAIEIKYLDFCKLNLFHNVNMLQLLATSLRGQWCAPMKCQILTNLHVVSGCLQQNLTFLPTVVWSILS